MVFKINTISHENIFLNNMHYLNHVEQFSDETALIIGLEKAITLTVSNTVSPYHKAMTQTKDGIMCIPNKTLLTD